MQQIGTIRPVEITEEMERNYLDYAMSVIVSRALPDIRDGLKPVHRRILYAMQQMGLSHTSKHTKSAKVVGEVLGKFHPHGDAAVYDALVRLAQEFSMRYPLINGQGNFGSVDGDPPAAMRYTEVKLSAICAEMLFDIEKETVEFVENFDATLKEPVYLPARLPNLLLMGSDGIAVGMATKIPPHNLTEVVDAAVFLIGKSKVEKEIVEENTEREEEGQYKGRFDPRRPLPKVAKVSITSEAEVMDLTEYIKGPDFPTGGAVYDEAQIKEVYASGRGKIDVRGVAEIVENTKGKTQIVITELPYQVNKATLVEKIADLVKEKKLEGIADLRDESDREGLRVVLDLKREARPKAILNNLYSHTQLQTSFPANFVALVDGTPQTVNLKQILSEYVLHRQDVVTKRSLFELKQARFRAHVLEGLKIALDNLDAVIKTIRESNDVDAAREALMRKFDLTEIQANAILEMQLRRLAALERQKIEDEYSTVEETVDYLENLLAHPEKVLVVVKGEIEHLKERYADKRRTKVYKQPLKGFSEEDLVPNEEVIITRTESGYIKRVGRDTYRIQRRGGKGVTGMETKEEDEVTQLITADTHDMLYFFTNKGRVFSTRVWEVPEGSRQSKGKALVNFINLAAEEQGVAMLTLPKESAKLGEGYLMMATKQGIVKKTPLSEFANIRANGLIAIGLKKGDDLVWVRLTSGGDHVMLVSHEGKSIRFSEKDARSMGRSAQGVIGMRMRKGDFVVGMEVFSPKLDKPVDKRRKVFRDILVVMEKGLGKRTEIGEFPIQKRGGMGVKVANVTNKTGKITTAKMVDNNTEQVVMTSKSAQVIKLPLKNIPTLTRDTQGVILMRFSDRNDAVAAVTTLEKNEDEEG